MALSFYDSDFKTSEYKAKTNFHVNCFVRCGKRGSNLRNRGAGGPIISHSALYATTNAGAPPFVVLKGWEPRTQ